VVAAVLVAISGFRSGGLPEEVLVAAKVKDRKPTKLSLRWTKPISTAILPSAPATRFSYFNASTQHSNNLSSSNVGDE
jgi:hypothetical protein